jgi:hypothetical protein
VQAPEHCAPLELDVEDVDDVVLDDDDDVVPDDDDDADDVVLDDDDDVVPDDVVLGAPPVLSVTTLLEHAANAADIGLSTTTIQAKRMMGSMRGSDMLRPCLASPRSASPSRRCSSPRPAGAAPGRRAATPGASTPATARSTAPPARARAPSIPPAISWSPP